MQNLAISNYRNWVGVVLLENLKSHSVMVNHALLDQAGKSIRGTHLTKTKRLPKLSASLTRMNIRSSRLTSTLDKKHLLKWEDMMMMSRSMVAELNHLRSLLTSS